MSELERTFPAAVYAQRLTRAGELAAQQGIDVLLVGTGADFAYLTGSWISSHERLTVLVITPGSAPVIVAPATDAAALASAPVGELGIEIRGWRDGADPYVLALGEEATFQRVALGSSLTADHVLRFQSLLPQARWELATLTLSELFGRKDAAEIAELRAAAAAIDAVHEAVPGMLVPGVSEEDVAKQLRELILREHDAVDFIIVGSGPNGANPHYDFGPRILQAGDPVVVDIGGTLASGYHSDCTRTYVVGGDITAAPLDFQRAYAVLEKAQAAGRATARPGVTAQEVDRATRRVIEQAGWGDYFTHRTGHGIGLSGHEEPFIIEGNELELEEDMAFSIEPGIYLPGKWGMRVEDIVITTAQGCESLNTCPREVR